MQRRGLKATAEASNPWLPIRARLLAYKYGNLQQNVRWKSTVSRVQITSKYVKVNASMLPSGADLLFKPAPVKYSDRPHRQ